MYRMTASLGLALAVVCAPAVQAEDFYKGKSVSITVGSSSGGGYDTYARFLARHWGRFIPGTPGFVVKNMPGAGSLKACNYIYNVAARDGTEVGAPQQGMFFEPLFKVMGSGRDAKFDALKFGWIGAVVKDQAVMVTWHSTPFKSLADLKGKEILTGSAGATTNYATYPRLMNATMGTNIKVIEGYNGTSSITLALERGEVQAMTGWDYSSIAASKSAWLKDRKIRVLVQFGATKIPELPDVPLARDYAVSPLDRDVLDLITIRQDIGRPYVAPPNLPADRLKTLQTSFWAMLHDPAVLAEAKKARVEVSPTSAEEAMTIIRKGYAASPEVVAKARKVLIANARKADKKKK